MRLRIFTEPQLGATYDDQLAAAVCAEEAGFDAYFRSDHYLTMGGGDGLPGPSDAWVTLAGLARETSRIRLGTLLTSATFRLPGPLAISVAEVDAMSRGRVELGLGAGWYNEEHTAYGIPFPPTAERFERLEEQLAIMTGLWKTPAGQTFDFAGTHYQLSGSPALPKPTQRPHPPVIIGGVGLRRTPALAARFASEVNTPFISTEDASVRYAAADEACRAVGRDPDDLGRSAALVVCCGAGEAAVQRRAQVIGRDVDELKANGLCGRPDEVVAQLQAWKDAGAGTVYLQVLDLSDLDHIRLLGAEVLPAVA
ncbi:MAG: LLM class F420-dependent oxidoreductase [Actinomycetota bacterium]|nr:LLM class F420-dependent oxidoreductase [Actinomycetota bacterium]